MPLEVPCQFLVPCLSLTKKQKTYNNKNLDRVKAREVVVLRDLF